MPPRKSKAAKRPMRRRNYKKRSQVTVNRALNPIPQRYITKLKYSDVFTLQLTNSYQYVFNLNSLFDPNRSGIGHQPYGYDQLTPLYNRYRAIKCNYVINCYSTTSPIRYGCIASNEVPPINSVSELAENPRAQTRVQIPGGNTQKITGSIYLPSLFGRSKAEYMADDRYQAINTASPAELALLTIIGADMGDFGTTITGTITLEWVAEFFDVSPLDQS